MCNIFQNTAGSSKSEKIQERNTGKVCKYFSKYKEQRVLAGVSVYFLHRGRVGSGMLMSLPSVILCLLLNHISDYFSFAFRNPHTDHQNFT